MTGSDKDLLVVIGSLARGGCETHLLQVLPALVERGYRVNVFLLANRGVLAEKMEAAGVGLIEPWVKASSVSRPLLAFRLYRLTAVFFQLVVYLLKSRPRIIHFFLPASYLIGAPAAIVSGIRNRVMSRRSLNVYQEKYPVLARAEHFLHRWMVAVLGNSQAVVNELAKEEGVPLDKVGLVYNGIDFSAYDEQPAQTFRQGWEVADNELLISVVANLIPYKGHLDLFEALAAIKTQIKSDWRLILAGRDDGHGALLQTRCEQLGLQEHVVFLGQFDDIPKLLRDTDVFVLPSHEEGFSNALLEAMAAGLAPVATDVGGNSEAVVDGETGFIVPPQNPGAMAEAILALINDEGLRHRLGDQATRHVRQKYSIAHCVDQYDLFYSTLLARGNIASLKPFQWSKQAGI